MKGNFQKMISGSQPVLVDFHATWCGPCKMQAPILKEVSAETEGKARILKIDVDRNRQLADKYQVRGVPTLILFKNGKPVWRQSGVAQKHQLIKLINQNA
ncbi:thioredoxin [Roseivirga sp. BDSF3-8]|uniref:thioredoxin n=1 Tax=Roseivirga sp. BDSF3-8 TaxID=3241598 RepID=UPI00353268BC